MNHQQNNSAIFLAKCFTFLAAVCFLLMPISALGSRFEWWPVMIGLGLFALSAFGGLVIEVIVSFWLWRKPQGIVKTHLRRASLLALPPLIITAGLMRGSTGNDLLHDVSTDTLNPPQFQHALSLRGENSNSLDYSSEKKALQEKLYPKVKSITNQLDQQKNYRIALTAAEKIGFEITAKSPPAKIEAIASTYWFGFKNDVVIRIKDKNIDIRSVSRIGKSDFGANAKGIEKFIMLFEKLSHE